MKKLLIGFLAVAFAAVFGVAYAADTPRLESDFVKKWCAGDTHTSNLTIRDDNGAVAGYVDCYIDNGNSRYAVEFDFSNKWAEALGQSLWYALETGSKPAIALIHKAGTSDVAFARHYDNLTTVLANTNLPITIICIGFDGNEKPCIAK